MNVVRAGLGLILVLLLLVGSSTGAVVAEEDGRFLVGTWNAGLFPWLDSAAIIKKIPTNFHVLGLTEVWSEAHAQAIIKALRKTYPFSYYVPATQGTPIGCISFNPYCGYLGYDEFCSIEFSYAAVQCLIQTGVPTDTTWLPALDVDSPCSAPIQALFGVDSACAACISNELHRLPFAQALDSVNTCANLQGARYDFGGFPGLLLLSKHRIQNIRLQEPASFLTKKVIVFARINGVEIAFSQLPYDLEIPLPFPQPSQALQSDFANAMIASKADVLMGDFNSGTKYQSDAHNALLGAGYGEVFSADTYCTTALASDPRCTDQPPLDIDHIYVKRWRGLRIYMTGGLFDNQPGLSDHAGIGLKWKTLKK